MKADHATWETGLVIPEATKTVEEQMLDAFLRVEALLEKVLGKPEFIPVSPEAAEVIEEIIEEHAAPKTKGRRK
jgi:hypothetical protein